MRKAILNLRKFKCVYRTKNPTFFRQFSTFSILFFDDTLLFWVLFESYSTRIIVNSIENFKSENKKKKKHNIFCATTQCATTRLRMKIRKFVNTECEENSQNVISPKRIDGTHVISLD